MISRISYGTYSELKDMWIEEEISILSQAPVAVVFTIARPSGSTWEGRNKLKIRIYEFLGPIKCVASSQKILENYHINSFQKKCKYKVAVIVWEQRFRSIHRYPRRGKCQGCDNNVSANHPAPQCRSVCGRYDRGDDHWFSRRPQEF